MKTFFTAKNGMTLFFIFVFQYLLAQEANKKLPITTTWNGASWSNGVPNAQTKAVFEADFIANQTIIAESIEVAPNAKVTFTSGTNLIVTNEVKVSPLGNLTFEVNANLSQKNPNIVNSTLATFQRQTPYITKFDYVYWSSPVQGQNIGTFSPDTLADKYLQYTPATGWQSVPPATNTMEVGKGYAIRGPQQFVILDRFTGTFTGIPNNSDVTTPIGVGSNLIGNPYSDALSADCFILDPDNQTAVGGCLFFWTHNIPIDFTGLTPGTAVYNYNVNSYAPYNLLGGVGAGVTVVSNQILVDRPKGYVASGQGFFVNGVANGSASFKTSMRSSDPLDNEQFFRTTSTNVTASTPPQCTIPARHRIWVRLTNGNYFKETLVGYSPAATTSGTLDRNYDAKAFSTSTVIDMYSLAPVSQEKLTIQGRVLGASFNTDDVIPLGFTCPAGDNTISATDFDGLFGSQMFWLKETVGSTITYRDIRTSGYTFTTAASTTDDTTRFQIVFKNNLNTTQLQPSFCGITVSNLNNSLFCYQVAGATGYIFEVTEVGNPGNVRTITRTGSSFSMQMLPGITTLGTTYSVRVSPIIGGLSQGFGPACLITTPALPPTTSLSNGCGTSNAIWVSFFINQVQPIGGVAPTKYRVQVVNITTGITSYLDLIYPNSSFQLQNTGFVPAVTVANNMVYDISVAYEWNGVWQNYGPICTHSKLFKLMQNANGTFEAIAYPNPFNNSFSIEMQTNSDENVSIKAYDMLGRLVETLETTISDFYSQKIGNSFSSGVYNIVVTQGDNSKTIRVIKR